MSPCTQSIRGPENPESSSIYTLVFGFCLFIYFQICGLTIEPRDTLDKCSVLELCATDPLSFYHFHNR